MAHDSDKESPPTSPAQGSATWVPQIFYDLIARIVPGLALVVGIVIVLLAGNNGSELINRLAIGSISWASATILIITAFSLSYSIAVLISGLRYLLFAFLFRIPSKILRWKRCVPIVAWLHSLDIETGIRDSDGDFWLKYDHIKKEFPSAGNRITKLKAEIHMSHVLLVGLPLILALTTLIKGNHFWLKYYRWALAIGTLGSIGQCTTSSEGFHLKLRTMRNLPGITRVSSSSSLPNFSL